MMYSNLCLSFCETVPLTYFSVRSSVGGAALAPMPSYNPAVNSPSGPFKPNFCVHDFESRLI